MRGNIKSFTHIEVVIIIGLLCTALLLLAKVFPLGFEAKHKAEDYSIMGVLVQKILEEIKKEGYRGLQKKYPEVSPGYGRKEGIFDEHPRFSWQVEWWQTEIPNLRKVKVRVYGKTEKEGTPSEIKVITYLANRE